MTRAGTGQATRARDAGGRTLRWRGFRLWGVALLMMLAAAAYQRRTGPTYPVRGRMEVAGESYAYRLARSGSSSEGARVAIPDPGPRVSAELHFKRYRTDDPFTTVPMRREDEEMVARLPGQPAAGKLEYYVTLDTPGGGLRVPEPETGQIIVRFKDDVPIYVLLPHVLFMFFAMLVGVRAGLGAAFGPDYTRRLAWTALGLMTVGGMVLGPIVQKFAFGAFWTGFPSGYDLTDNKVLIMWLVWLVACLVVGWRVSELRRRERIAVAAAALVMLGVYLIPHSAQGSELDWEAVERGMPPSEAVKTGPESR